MKRTLLTCSFIVLTYLLSNAQTFFQDNFESYSAGQNIVDQSDDWITWSGNPLEDMMITDEVSQSGENSLLCQGGFAYDVVLPFSNINEGSYTVEFSMYVVSGNGAYYNFQEDQIPGTAWAFENFFATDGTWEIIMDTEVLGGGDFPHNQWFRVSNKIDLINDEVTIEIDGVPFLTFTFDSPLGGVNIFPFAPNFETALYYVDDVFVYKSFEGFEDYPDGVSLGLVSQQWSTWSGSGAGTDEDAVVTNFLSATGSNCAQFSGAMTDVLYPMGNFTQGLWELNMKIFTGSGGGGFLNIQHFEEPGISFANQIFFGGGSGSLDAGGAEAATFDWVDDQWNEMTHIINLDADIAGLLINGTTVHTWTFSDEALSSGTGETVLGSIDFFPNAAPAGTVGNFFVDDITFDRSDFVLSDHSIQSIDLGLSLFPNPSKDYIYIQYMSNNLFNGWIEIYNILGKNVMNEELRLSAGESINLDISNWISGVYIVYFRSIDGIQSLKLVVE